MSAQYLTDAAGKNYAVIESMGYNTWGIRDLRNPVGILAKYDGNTNTTINLQTGQIIGKGNLLASVVPVPRY